VVARSRFCVGWEKYSRVNGWGGIGSGWSGSLSSFKGQTHLSGHPLLFGFPLSVVLLLEGMKRDVSWEECDLWRSQARADHWQGTSLQCPVVMQAIYRLITVLWVPERNVVGRWGGVMVRSLCLSIILVLEFSVRGISQIGN